MAFCKNCGAQVEDGIKFCASCGTPVDQQAAPAQPAVQQAQPAAPAQPVLTGEADVQANKGMAALSYLGILLLVPLFARKNSEYCQHHVKQGFTLAAFSLCFSIVYFILNAIISAIFPPTLKYGFLTYYYAPSAASVIWSIIGGIISIGIGVVAIIGIVNAVKGEKKDLPIFGSIKLLHPLVDKIYAALNK